MPGWAGLGWAGLGARVPTVGGCHQPMVEHIWAGLGKCALECGEPSSPAQVTLYGKCAGQGRAGRCGLCSVGTHVLALHCVLLSWPGPGTASGDTIITITIVMMGTLGWAGLGWVGLGWIVLNL